MLLYIPKIGDQIKLIKCWEFPVYFEKRNLGLISRINPHIEPILSRSCEESIGCCLPAGTVLQIDRVYVRSRLQEHDSITFRVRSSPSNNKLKNVRFWAALHNVNEIEYERIE